MSRKRYLSPKGEAKKDKRKFLRFLRSAFKHMPKGYNPYLRPTDRDAERSEGTQASSRANEDVPK